MDTRRGEVPQCMGRTTKGHRCKLKGRRTSDCYGVAIPVCGHHTEQNSIHEWSRFQHTEHTPELIRDYLEFYEHCVYSHGFRKVPSISITTEMFKDTPGDADTADIVVGFVGKTMAPQPESTQDCSICMENKCGDMCSLHCDHTFCYPCIMTWVFSNPTCPMCRKNISRNIK